MEIKYTTLQMKEDFMKSMRIFCALHGLKMSPTTEMLWGAYISASISGSTPLLLNLEK